MRQGAKHCGLFWVLGGEVQGLSMHAAGEIHHDMPGVGAGGAAPLAREALTGEGEGLQTASVYALSDTVLVFLPLGACLSLNVNSAQEKTSK
jgi:hypothetical protein